MSEDRSLLSDARLRIARRDVASLSREKTIVLALLIQLFVAGFSSFLVVGLTSLYDPGSVATSEVEVAITGDARAELVEASREHPETDVVAFADAEQAQRQFDRGEVDALLRADYQEREESDGRAIGVTATIPEGSIRSTLIVVQIRQLLGTLERQERLDRSFYLDEPPVPRPPEIGASPYFGFTYTVLIPLLLFLPPFISGSVAVDTITEEIERGTLELLRVAPVSLLDIVEGKALGMTAIAPAQALLWIGLLSANGIAVSNVVPIVLFVTAISVIVVAIGLVLGVTMGRRRPAQLLYSVLTLVIFGGAVVLPEHPSTTMAKLAVDSPTTLTYAHVGLMAAVAVGGYLVVRRYVRTVEPETL
ncbi:ABC transporter permease [Haloarcula montana]|uniref:ABC transporter permease n=1 Tax=Haloarcula montana TaxID=3111776 RepID=UPI002D787D23|nr:ABC transporter permease [Haloarcula sp. GH36]